MREAWLAASASALAACFSPSAPTGLPCGEGLTCPEGQTCDIISNECGAASEALFLRDDTAAEFGAGAGDVTIERAGFLSPTAYLTGGARISGYDGLFIGQSFDAIVADHAKTGTALQHSLRMNFQTLKPPGLGISDPDNVTILVEGEVELEATGAWRFQLTANDEGYFEIADPGSTTFTRVVADVDIGTVGTFQATTPGWHPFRAVFQDAGNFLDFDLLYDPPNVMGNGFRDIPTDRMRVKISDLEGSLLVDGFESENLIDHQGSVLSGELLKNLELAMDAFELPIGIGAFTLRWSGQFLIDDPGDFTFGLQTTQGHRLWIDGAEVIDEFTTGATDSTTETITLAAGWHDLVLDVNKRTGPESGNVSLVVNSGPQFGGGPLPADHLRPVIGRHARFVADRNLSLLAMPDGTGAAATRSLTVDLPVSLTTAIDIRAAVDVESGNLNTVSLVIDPPGSGADVIVAAVGDMTGTGARSFHVPFPLTNLGSVWQFVATDTLADMLTGAITNVFVTIVHDGGIAPFATTSHYESAIRDLGDPVAFERIAWTTRAVDPSAVVVKLRTCDTEDCAGEPYVDVVNNSEPSLTPRRFVQYTVDITSDGDASPALDAVELRYFVRGMQ